MRAVICASIFVAYRFDVPMVVSRSHVPRPATCVSEGAGDLRRDVKGRAAGQTGASSHVRGVPDVQAGVGVVACPSEVRYQSDISSGTVVGSWNNWLQINVGSDTAWQTNS
jgi:hypothetical protein